MEKPNEIPITTLQLNNKYALFEIEAMISKTAARRVVYIRPFLRFKSYLPIINPQIAAAKPKKKKKDPAIIETIRSLTTNSLLIKSKLGTEI